jgi:hypothetical protein
MTMTTSKPPEEGRIWEWRTFDPLDDEVLERVRSHPIRMGIQDASGEDVYFIAPYSDQNVKLRLSGAGWVLKFKLLVEARPGGFELYDESVLFTYLLPVSRRTVLEAAGLLNVTLSADAFKSEPLGADELEETMGMAVPTVEVIRIQKTRSQYQFDGGWFELARVSFENNESQSLSVHSTDLKVVERALSDLGAADEPEPTNYVQACRKWIDQRKSSSQFKP